MTGHKGCHIPQRHVMLSKTSCQTHHQHRHILSHTPINPIQPTLYLLSRADSSLRSKCCQHTRETNFSLYLKLMQLLSLMCFGKAWQFDYQSNTRTTLNIPSSPVEEGAQYLAVCREICHVLWTHIILFEAEVKFQVTCYIKK